MSPKKRRTCKNRRKQTIALDSPSEVEKTKDNSYAAGNMNQNDFQSISSDGDAADVRPRRKVIRRTEQLQIIDANVCVVTDTTNRRTRMRTRRLDPEAVLPKIENIIEETNNKVSKRKISKNRKKTPAGQQRQEPSDLLSTERDDIKYDLRETKDPILSQSSSDSQTLLTVSALEMITDTKDECKQEKCDEEIVNSDTLIRKSETDSYDHKMTDELRNSTRNEGQINENDNPPSESLKTPNKVATKPPNMKIEICDEGTGVHMDKQLSALKVRGTFCKNTPKPLKDQSVEKPRTRTKMPNFALIHKKASEKMEDIQQMTQRKANRARLLLSGHKPAIGLEKCAGTEDKKSHRQLNFGSENIPRDTNLPLANGIHIKSDINKVLAPKIITKPFKVKNNMNKCKLLNNKPKNRAVIASLLNDKSVPVKPSKPQNEVKVEDIVNQKLSPALRGATYINLKAIKKVGDEEKKALANKVQVVKSGLKERRDLIKGVRSNRRFELLMKMRMKV